MSGIAAGGRAQQKCGADSREVSQHCTCTDAPKAMLVVNRISTVAAGSRLNTSRTPISSMRTAGQGALTSRRFERYRIACDTDTPTTNAKIAGRR